MWKLNFKRILILSYLGVVLLASIFFYYYLPKTKKIYVVGTEIKRERLNTDKEVDPRKDIRYVVARDAENGDTLMFRNQDIAWPPYFKFDSGDLAGKVMNYKEYEEDKKFLATYYGWRIPLFSMYPNLTDLIDLTEKPATRPWFNIIFLSIFYLATVLVFIFYLKPTKV